MQLCAGMIYYWVGAIAVAAIVIWFIGNMVVGQPWPWE